MYHKGIENFKDFLVFVDKYYVKYNFLCESSYWVNYCERERAILHKVLYSENNYISLVRHVLEFNKVAINWRP